MLHTRRLTDTVFDLHIFGYNQHSLCDKALLHSAVMDEHYDLSLASKQQYMSHYIYISHKMKVAHSEQLQRNASNLNQNCKYLLLCQYVTITDYMILLIKDRTTLPNLR